MSHPKVGVGAVICDQAGRWLLLKRKRKPEAGCWSIPGGKVEWMERIEDAICREVYEELGVEIELIRLLGVTNHLLQEEQMHWVAPTFLARIVRGTPMNREKEKHAAVQWLHPTEWPSNITETTKAAFTFLEQTND